MTSKRDRFRLAALVLFVMGFVATGSASAHGPTIDVTHDKLEPALLNLFVGSVVHFNNTVSMPGGHVIVDEAGTIKSPVLSEPGDGWHYTFDEVGTFDLFIEQHPNAKARIVVVPKR